MPIKHLNILFLGLLVSQLVKGQQIFGLVTDSLGEPLPGVQVFLENTGKGSMTDINGYYRIRNIRPGTYTVNIKMLGYVNQKRSITLSVHDSIQINFHHQSESIIEDYLKSDYYHLSE